MGYLTERLRTVRRPVIAAVTLLGLAAATLFYQRVGGVGLAANALGLVLIDACLIGPDSVISGSSAQDAASPRAAATATGLVNGVGSLGAIVQGSLNAW